MKAYIKTLLWFYVFRKFRNLNYEEISFIEKSYFPKNKRDKRLSDRILDFNRNRIKNNH